jgi:hypothetical protein
VRSPALAAQAGIVLLPPGPSDALASRVLNDAGVAVTATASATLSLAVEQAIDATALIRAREAVRALDPAGAAERVGELVRKSWRIALEEGRLRPRGLPRGLEPLRREPLPTRPDTVAEAASLESRVDAELAALKKRVAGREERNES